MNGRDICRDRYYINLYPRQLMTFKYEKDTFTSRCDDSFRSIS